MRTQLSALVDILYLPLRLLFSVEQLDMIRLTKGSIQHRNLRPVYIPACRTIADYMVDVALQKTLPRIRTACVQQPVRLMDPCCGNGVFIAAILEKTKHIAGELIGLERDPWQSSRCRNKYRFLNAFKEKMGIIAHSNFLDDTHFQSRDSFDVIVSFPPPYQEEYMQHLYNAHEHLAPGGALVMLIPAAAFESMTTNACLFRNYLHCYNAEVERVPAFPTDYPIPYNIVVIQKP